MKLNVLLKGITWMLLPLTCHSAFAQSGNIVGRVLNAENLKPIGGATIVLDNKRSQKEYTTDSNGYYYCVKIDTGTYRVFASFLGDIDAYENVKLADSVTIDVSFILGMQMVTPPTSPGCGLTYTYDDLKNTRRNQRVEMGEWPYISLRDIMETLPAVVNVGGNYYARGARLGSMAYYVDGCKTTGMPDIPISGIDNITTNFGFLPAKYGDAVGGVILIESRDFFSEQLPVWSSNSID